MDKKLNIISNLLLAFIASTFILFYFTLSFYNRPASDDILFISILKGENMMGYLRWFYITWSGRWTTNAYFYLIMAASNTFQNIHYYMFIYYSITILILLYSVHSILSFFINKLFGNVIVLSWKITITFSIVFIASFYYLTFQYIETWWWMDASVDTLQGIVFLLFGVSILLKENKKPVHYILIGLSFIYVGGGYEIYSLIVIALFLLTIIYFLFNKKKETFSFKKNALLKGFTVALLSLLIAFSISAFSPGNMKRRAYLLNDNKTEMSSPSTENVGTMLIENVFTQKKYLAGIGLSALFLLLGMKLRNSNNFITNRKKMKTVLLLSLLVLVISILVPWMFQYFILDNSFIPLRGWTFTSFSLTIFLSVLFLFVGCTVNISSIHLQSILKIMLPALMLFIFTYNLFKQYNYANNYATCYDKLIDKLIDEGKNTIPRTVYVDQLPDPGMLCPMDISDSSITMPIKEILNLKYDIEVKK